jgi:glyoxylase-like metal-dependent hydrolase (beta-lactamase superfamily II)
MSKSSDLYFRQLHVGEMANLAYLLGSLSTREAMIVDPAWQVNALLDRAEADGMKVVGALATHYHQDHIGGEVFGMKIEGVEQLLSRHPVPIHVHQVEADGLKKITGASESDLVRRESGDEIVLGEVRIRLIHTPGHTPGSQCFLVEDGTGPGHLVSGDTLFLGSCGRVDLPGSDPAAMYESLHNKLARLPDETLLFPGHLYAPEPSSSIGEQKRTNPFLRVARLQDFLAVLGS